MSRLLLPGLLAFSCLSAQEKPAFRITPAAGEIMDTHCSSCHGEDSQKGDIRLDQLESMTLPARLELLNRMQEQAYLGHMPPKDRKKQPTPAERKTLVDWIAAELKVHNASKLEDKMRMPAYGNYVDHDKLFSGEIKDAPFTPARRWLVSPTILFDRIEHIFGPEERGKQGNSYGKPFYYGVTNPTVLPDASGVRYYDNDALDGGILLVMLTNVEWISQKQIRAARVKNGEIKPDHFPDPKDRWSPKKTPPAFESVILSKTPPTDEQIGDAIRTQFAAVLRRSPSESELSRYLRLTREAVAVGGNTEGLRQMLVAVLLESEFLYRLEFGAGPADAHGRKMLSPAEGAEAIAYALGDRGPDPKLLEAARKGQLQTREDYRREVLRLLDDKTYYKWYVDPVLTNNAYRRSHTTSHPRIIRFFREFFGYPNAVKVFKDPERSGFYYQNPGRGTFGTPGELVNEADILVDHIVSKDRNVFETLLGTGEYFVAPVEDAAKKMAMLDTMYEHFKDTDWKKNPETVVKEHADFIKKNMPYGFGAKQLTGAMIHVEKFRAKKLPPNPDWSYAFGHLMLWAQSYNIEAFDWNYPVQQPFKVENRKGILTHPAWLIAHSLNTENDPVRRGRWVREKLLAGRVPDVPITVDAVVPEDHHKTLRDRLEKVTSAEQCVKCHQYMNPLGLPFENYDDFGRFRLQEPLEHAENIVGKGGTGKYAWNLYKTLPVNARGVLDSTGDPTLDGPVTDAMDMIGRLAKSPRVRQSFIRHAFRFYMGRNEMLSDSQTLIEADKAYLQSGGSFRAVIVSLLTSDSFLYRK